MDDLKSLMMYLLATTGTTRAWVSVVWRAAVNTIFLLFPDVSVLVQFALLERSTGSRERAEALLEQVLAVYPQRVDVAAVYADMLLKGGEVDQVRWVAFTQYQYLSS